MPTIKTDLPNFTDFPKLRKLRDDILRRVQLYAEEKRVKFALSGDKKRGVKGLNSTLFYKLRAAVTDPNVKSFEFDVEDSTEIQRYCVSMVVPEKAKQVLDKAALISTPWEVEVKCPCKCGKTFKVSATLPPKILKMSMKPGKLPDPTVSVRRLGESESVAANDEEEEE